MLQVCRHPQADKSKEPISHYILSPCLHAAHKVSSGVWQSKKQCPDTSPLCQWVPAISVPTHTWLSPSLVSDHAREHFGLHFPYTGLETAQLAHTAVAFQLSLLQALIITYKRRQKAKHHVSPLLSIQLLHLPKRSLMSSRTALAEISL